MSTLAADTAFTFTFPTSEVSEYPYDTSLLTMPYNPSPSPSPAPAPAHARSSSVYSTISTLSAASASTVDSVSTRMTTPPRSSPPVRHHGPILLPKIRSQDQAIETPAKRPRTSASPARVSRRSHMRSYTNPESLSFAMPQAQPEQQGPLLLCRPATFATPAGTPEPRRASSCGVDARTIERYGFPYRQMPTYLPSTTQEPHESFLYIAPTDYPQPQQTYQHREATPLSFSPGPTPTATLLDHLSAANPAPSLVRTISYHHRDPNTKHFWWDVRQVRPWTFDASTVLSLPGASGLLTCPVAAPLLPMPQAPSRHPETEAALHGIYASHYLPRLNAALALSSTRPLALSVPPKPASSATGPADLLFVANGAGEDSSAAAIFGGRPTARVVGLVRSFDRFNTGMRVEGNVKRVEYLRGLAALQHAMRERSCRYGFILTEIELVLVRNGTDSTPYFGYLEVASLQLASAPTPVDLDSLQSGEAQLPACLALWALCTLASDDLHPLAPDIYPSWKSEIGAPAEGTRRKALPRDDWIPKPQLAEKREAKRSRGWVMPEDAVGRKELGKRGVRYAAC